MSSISYGQLSPTGTSLPHDFRRPSAALSSYDHLSRRRSPSPGPFTRRLTYDSYKPRNGPYYDDHPNCYRPNVYRPQRYFSRSPSPLVMTAQDHRNVSGPRSRWQHKRPSPSPPPWDKNRRDTLAERMLEPQEVWKQSHLPIRPDSIPDRYGDRRQQSSRDHSPQRPAVRSDFVPHYDSYRPSVIHAVRDYGSFSRTADTYRPQYQDDPWSSSHTGDSVSHQRKPSYHDRADERPGSSISSTPPRQHASLPESQPRSSPSRPLAEMESLSSSHFRGSSMFREGPDTKSESRSSSRSPKLSRSGISELDEEFALPRLSIQPVQEKASLCATNGVPLSSDDSGVPIENSKGLGKHVSADKQSSSHEIPYMNGNLAARQITLETHALPFLIPESASSSNTTPLGESPLEVVVPHVEADSTTNGSLRPSLESSKVDRSVTVERSTSTERATLNISTTPLEDIECQKLPPPSLTAIPSPITQIPETDFDVISGAIEPGPNFDRMNIITTPDPAAGSLRIMVSDHSTTPASPANRSALCQPANLKSTREGVRLVLVTRLRYDRQSRVERAFPVLRANQAVSNLNLPPPTGDHNRRSEELIAADSSSRLATHEAIRSSLVDRFAERQSEIVEKSRRLKAEYLALHERWLDHCVRLDELQKTGIPEESAAHSSGRTTRRSTAVMGDAVRSDLEMEQIIASLGVEELTDPSYLAIKNVARIPDMISVTEGSVPYLFDDTNNIVDDPSEFYGASSGQDYWTEEERDIFLNEFAAHPKQFGLVSQRLPNKTAAQCVTYYYLHKKQGVDFKKAVMQYGTSRRRKNGRPSKQRGNALLADIRRHDDEVSRNSPTSLNESASSTGNKRKRAVDRSNGESRRSSTSRRITIQPEVTSSGTTPDPDVEQPRRRRRTAISTRAVTVVTANEVVNDDVIECPVIA
ncbi:hypothetical protein L210DRAFT_3761656 [Boletus edulis BED1]|uniref:SANT domain-containing protein n=1 Tax=Boletus edulis BED1 TaxID=1328754 RepID=A0AAD4BR84_BOLED|nr:hypothetical protein L210DRAFT_3761656 [Boletus edulis BED1]